MPKRVGYSQKAHVLSHENGNEILNGNGRFVCSYAAMQPVTVSIENTTHILGFNVSKAGPMGLKDLPQSRAPNLSFTFIFI